MKILGKKGIIIGTTLVIMFISAIFLISNNFSETKQIDGNDDLLVSNVESKDKEVVSTIRAEVKGEVVSPGVYELDAGSRLQDLVTKAGGFKDSAYYDNINLSMKLKDEMVLVVYNKSATKKSKKSVTVNKKTEVKKEVPSQSNSENKSKTVTSESNIKTTDEKCEVTNEIIDECLEKKESVIVKEEDTSEKEILETNENVETNITSSDNIENNIVKSETSNTNKIININTAGLKELSTLKGIGEAKAQKIIDYREANGSFKTIEDIMKVKGIGKATYEKFKANISV